MAIKKSELYSSLWQSCDELRGGMDASQYKDCELVLGIRKSNVSNETTVHDPICGCASLLVSMGDEASRDQDVRITLYGQEFDSSSAGLPAQPQLILEDKSKKTKTKPDFSIGKKKYAAELIPPALVIARYYPKDQAAIDALEAEVAAVEQELEEIAEEHSGEEDQLTEDEIKTLVVDDKWLATLAAAVQSELDRVSQTLTGRIRQLADRYAAPLPQIVDEVEQLAATVAGHLKKMGIASY